MPATPNARHQEALRLRNEGMSYGAIARALGYGNYPSAARYAVMSALRAQATTATTTLRQFGIEAEFYNIDVDTALEALRAVGIRVSFEGYTHAVMSDWKIVTDSSVTPIGTGRGVGLELVSPILKGEEGLATLAKALDALHRAGAKVNTTCGLHVHLDTAGMDATQRKHFFSAYVENQSVVDRLVARSRRNNRNYCKPYTSSQIGSALRSIELGQEWSSRFMTFNVNSFVKYGTFEVRQHQGTLNGKKAVAWVKMLLAIAETAQGATTANATRYNTVTELLAGHNVDASTTRILLAREAQLNRQALAA